MWFDTWQEIGRIALVGVVSYLYLVLLLRVTGKRTLSQFNAFDFVVTVALGSTVSTILLDSSVTVAEGATALAVLALLQLVVALITSRMPRVHRLLASPPTLLVWDGEVRRDALRSVRLGEADLMQAVRSSGCGSVGDVAAAVLEPSGTISVVQKPQRGDGDAVTGLLEDG